MDDDGFWIDQLRMPCDLRPDRRHFWSKKNISFRLDFHVDWDFGSRFVKYSFLLNSRYVFCRFGKCDSSSSVASDAGYGVPSREKGRGSWNMGRMYWGCNGCRTCFGRDHYTGVRVALGFFDQCSCYFGEFLSDFFLFSRISQ
ncbi:unknown protein [Waddlia chondrophila 2032/99]|uniref:Uncharacterized protein n=1 Tax=Waddlia chondrophila 2032/99 TaxID=765953 RepID=F8LC02_9BACT|nr:unknown protein [Waddlia chondrophila 2032/99]